MRWTANQRVGRSTPISLNALLSVVKNPVEHTVQYITWLHSFCRIAGIDVVGALIQAIHESAFFKSPRYIMDGNPVGLAIVADDTTQPFHISDGREAALAHVQALYSMIHGELSDSLPPFKSSDLATWFDDVWLPKVRDPKFPRVITWNEMGTKYVGTDGQPRATWAWESEGQPTYGSKLEKFSGLFGEIIPNTDTNDTGGPVMTERPSIVLIAGHRNYSGGNATEKALTPGMARAYRDVFRSAGYNTIWLQEVDGDTDPDDTLGGLDVVSRKAQQLIENLKGPVVLLDLHFEVTSSTVSGQFAIVPDRTGLRTAAPATQHPLDYWHYNTLDRAVAEAITMELASDTGIKSRTAGTMQPGVMSEKHTGVGYDGWRLATFAYTSPSQPRCVRLVVEHGNLANPSDKAICTSPDFPVKAAKAAMKAISRVYEVDFEVPQDYTDYMDPVPPPTMDTFTVVRDGVETVYLAVGKQYKIERPVVPRLWADRKSGPTGPELGTSKMVTVTHSVVTSAGEHWVLIGSVGDMAAGSRIPVSALAEK